MKEQYATKRLLLIPANKSLTEAVTDYYVRNRTSFSKPMTRCARRSFLPTVTSGRGWIWTSRTPCRRRATGFIW